MFTIRLIRFSLTNTSPLMQNSLYLRRLSSYIVCNSGTRVLQTDTCKNKGNTRSFSFQSTIQNVIETQQGIFKILSESTPVLYSQNFLIKTYEITGLPWWANIILCTVILRTVITLPFSIYHHYILSKVENLKLEMPAIVEELKKETAIAVKLYKWDEKTAKYYYMRSVKKQWNNLIIRDNCHPFKAALILWVQIPMWISLSVAFRNLVYMLPNQDLNAKLIFYKLATGGIGWIPDLTVPDPIVLPLLLGIINLSIIEIQLLARQNAPTKLQKILTNVFRGLTIILIPISTYVPSCIVLYWTTSSAYGLIQNLCLMSPKIRRICRIPQTKHEVTQPYTLIISKAKNKLGIPMK